MSNIIPPLLSNTPPPPPSPEDDDDDEFGDFTGVNDLSYGCDNLSLPPSPDHSPKEVSISNGLDINSNSDKNKVVQVELGVEKDFQDKRKGGESNNHFCKSEQKYVNNIEENILEYSKNPIKMLHVEDNHIRVDSDGLENNCDSHWIDDASMEQKQVIKSESRSCIKQHASEDNVNNIEKINDIPISDEKQESLSFRENDNLKECNLECESEIVCSSSSKVEEKIDLEESALTSSNFKNSFNEMKIDPVGSVTVEPSCQEFNFNTEVNNCNDITEDRELNSASFNIHEVNNCETSHLNPIDGNQFENKSGSSKDNIHEVEVCADDEFADFAFTAADNNSEEITFSQKKLNEDDIPKDTSPNILIVSDNDYTLEAIEGVAVEDDFDDFCEFTSNVNVQDFKQNEVQFLTKEESDDFGNFANFSEIVEEPVILLLNEKQAFEKSNSILKEMFPSISDINEEYHYINMESNDFIFNELKDITETNALTYQWSKSASQKMLLKALNIDARNILCGASWNPSMPRFAANLGLTPLEPIKTEATISSALNSSPSTSSQPPTSDIPSAQFDWNGSGLVNPLDYSQTMLLDLEQLVVSLDIPKCNASFNTNNSSSPTNELNDWENWLHSVPKEPTGIPEISDAKKSLKLPAEKSILQPDIVAKPFVSQKVPSKNDLEQEVVTLEENTDDFEDFTSYQTSKGSETWSNVVVPLRETYISGDAKELPLDISNWLQPTIVTPELPRRDLEIGDEELPNIQTPEFTRKQVALDDNDDEFDDFKMVSPEATSPKNDIAVKSSIPFDFLQPIQPERKESSVISSLNLGSFDFTNLSLSEDKSKLETTDSAQSQSKINLEVNNVEEIEPVTVDDDDFTEFHCSIPTTQPAVIKPLTPILQPLKPVPVYPTVSTTPSSQINWPDPGITEEEIKKFEMVFQRPQEFTTERMKKEEPKKGNEQAAKVSKINSFDDDDWSDFVSVQKPSPVHKFHANEKERTSSPDLPLSVLNLGSIQPTKQPIPVITPQGLIQTKLSSNSALNLSPKMQQKTNVINTQQRPSFHKPQIQPSIISNQFASQLYNFNIGSLNQTKASLNFKTTQPQNPSPLQPLDEDDWSDFMSSPLPSTTANGYQQNYQNTSTYTPSNWTNPSPNIITNPGHFVQSGSDMRNKKVPNVSVNGKKSTIPSISLPELEFIAPKGRTSSSRRK